MTTHPDAAALLADILDHPEDDTPRLVYADWLEIERGEAARAEFIRVQVELAGMAGPKQGDGRSAGWFCKRTGTWTAWDRWGRRCRCRLCSLRRREYEASKRHRVWEWREGIPQTITVEYGRGFVDVARCTLDAWLEHGPAIVRAHPVTRVEATDKAGQVPHAAGWRLAADPSDFLLGDLPLEVWLLLSGGEPGGPDYEEYIWYATHALAFDALSDALLAWARSPDRLEAAS